MLALIPIVPRADSGWALVIPLIIAGAGLGLLVSQLNNYTLSPISDERVSEAAGVNSAAGSFGLSFGLAFSGAIMLATLSIAFTQMAQDSTVLPADDKEQVAQALEEDAEVMSNTAAGGADRRRAARGRGRDHPDQHRRTAARPAGRAARPDPRRPARADQRVPDDAPARPHPIGGRRHGARVKRRTHMPIDTLIAYVGVYANVEDAERDYQLVKDLHRESGLIDAYDAAVVERREDGKVKIGKKHETPTRVGGVLGGGMGLATGLVVALFPFAAVGGGLLVGATAGGSILGAVAGHAAAGMSRHDLKELGEHLDNGQAGLVVVAMSDMGAKVEAAMERAEKLEQKQLKADTEALERDAAALTT